EAYFILLDPDAGDYVWQDGSTGASYQVTDEGTYSVTLTNACGTASDEISATVQYAPSPFSLGNDTLICDGTDIEFSFDPNLGEFSWQDDATTSDYTITTEGLYSLTISNACGSISDDVLVSVLNPPLVDLG